MCCLSRKEGAHCHDHDHFLPQRRGHTGYGEEGWDILCSALSAMTMFLINTVEVAYASSVDYEIDDNTTTIRVRCRAALPEFEADELKRYAVSGIFLGYYQQLSDMLEEYGDYLDVQVVNRPYGGGDTAR